MAEEKTRSFISPRRDPIRADGKISYKESQKAWCLIRLKQEILQEFSQLKERSSSFGYQLRFYRNFEELEKAIKEVKKNQGVPPILMWFFKENKQNPN
jgi:hypothetical protein